MTETPVQLRDSIMTDNWTAKHYPPGTPVYLFRAIRPGETGPREQATLLTSYMVGSMKNEHPAFRTESGDYIEGCECWWIPVEEAERQDDAPTRAEK